MIGFDLRALRSATAAPAVAALLLSGCAMTSGQGPRPAVDNLALGNDSTGDPCTLQFRWDDPQARAGIDRSYSVNCSSQAGRASGVIRVNLERPEEGSACGAPLAITIAGIGPAAARRCASPDLGREGIEISFRRGGLSYRGIALSYVLGPLQTAMVAVAEQRVGAIKPVSVAFQVRDVPAFAGAAAANADVFTNTAGLLRAGIRRNQLGLYADASRDLNFAIGRLAESTSSTLRSELELEAGLADSNIGATLTAEGHFAAAAALLRDRASQTSDRYPLLVEKLRIYRALHQLNRRDAQAALAALDDPDPLTEAAGTATTGRGLLFNERVQRALNAREARSGDATRALANDAADRELTTLQIQGLRARSLAHIGRNQLAEAQKAIDDAQALFTALQANNARGNVAWLGALLDRQRARIAARNGTPQGLADATAAAERAVTAIRLSSQASGIESGQAEAEARVDHARYLIETARVAASADDRAKAQAAAMAEYESAIDALTRPGAPGVASLPGIEGYLDLLIADAKAGSAEAPAKFFRVVQVLAKPAVARQTAELQSIVNEDPAVAEQVRLRLQNLAEIRRLSNRITDAQAGAALQPDETIEGLTEQRRKLEVSNDAITSLLEQNGKFQSIDDSPVPLKELTDSVLRPGEVYFKLTALPNGATYGIAAARDRSVIYRSRASTNDLITAARTIRLTIDKDAPYDVGRAYGLFVLAAGDATELLTAGTTQRVVVDPSGPLEIVPLSVLVTDRESSLWYAQRRKTDPADFSQVKFMATRAEISTALSPRSFAITRAFKPITAGRAFLGIGRHQPPAPGAETTEVAALQKQGVCAEGLTIYKRIWDLPPISDRELGEGARALGDPSAPSLTGAAFTDTAVLADPEMGQARVIHFATHGLPEVQVGCLAIPPSLVTSLGGAGSDGLLSFNEVARLKLNANLVVLSACDTASSLSEQASRQAGIEGGVLGGLVRSFLAAEARAVMATYWKIPATEQSEQMLAAFYASGRTNDIGTALRDAQLTLIRTPRYSHPYNWGAFFLVGDGSKTMLGNTAVARGERRPIELAAR